MHSMSRKHFVQAAEIVKFAEKKHQKAIMQAFIELFRTNNGAFDSGRFETACGF